MGDREPSAAWDVFLATAVRDFRERQEALSAAFLLGTWERYDYDRESGTLTFSSAGRVGLIAEIEIVGSISTASGTWLWAWDNPSIAESKRHAMCAVRDYGRRHGFDRLSSPCWTADENDAWNMTAAAVHLLHLQGGYRMPHDGGATFLGMTSIRRVA